MPFYSGQATIVQSEVRLEVHCTIFREQPREGLRSWAGSFVLLEQGFMLDPGVGEVVLADGRKGGIIVTLVSPTADGGTGTFRGTGDPPA